MRTFLSRLGIMTAGLALTIFTGCATTAPTKFYALNSIPIPVVAQTPEPEEQGAIGIRKVTIPDYLDRPQLVTRTGENRLNISDFNMWAGSLKSDISRVLAENLSADLLTSRVYVYPWKKSIPIKYILSVDVTRFDGELGGEVTLRANWTIYGEDGKKLLFLHTTVATEKADKPGYEGLVAAKSRLLSQLSRDIAYAIRAR